jgi:hypothetical protein
VLALLVEAVHVTRVLTNMKPNRKPNRKLSLPAKLRY